MYTSIFGWIPDTPVIDLAFGSYIHQGMELITVNTGNFKAFNSTYATGLVEQAYHLGFDEYRKQFSAEDDDFYSPKCPPIYRELLDLYIDEYEDDDFEVLSTEQAGWIPVLLTKNKVRNVFYKIDAICRDVSGKVTNRPGSIFVLDHKSAGKDSPTFRRLNDLNDQSHLYTHALHMMYPNEVIFGVVYNYLIFKKSGCQLLRESSPLTLAQSQCWLWEINERLDRIEEEFDNFSKCSEDDMILTAFGRNTKSCFDYFRECPFYFICKGADPINPLTRYHVLSPPPGFKREFWNPMKAGEKRGYKMVNLGGDDND